MRDAVREGFLERLRSESNIVSVVSDYVPLKRKGRNHWGCCPFHQEKTPSFSVSEDKGFFFCFGCQSGGDVFQFLMKVENITFPEAVKLLAEKLHVPMETKLVVGDTHHWMKYSNALALDQAIADFFIQKLKGK